MPTGRPSHYSVELVDDIYCQLAEGGSMLDICSRPMMPHVTTVYRWLRRHEDFGDRYLSAREQAHTIADRAVAMALGEEAITDPQTAKVQLDAIKWTAARLAPKVYGNGTDLNLGGQADNPVATAIRWEC